MLKIVHHKVRHVAILMAMLWSFAAHAVQAPDKNQNGNVQNNVSAEKSGKNSPRMAQVRIGLKLTPYQPMAVKGRDGKTTLMPQALATIQHTLRARIERVNHFYFGDWHVETIPEAWSRETMKYRVKLRFYKRYGAGKDLEEMVGHTIVQGTLEGKNYLYGLKGNVNTQFKNRRGEPVLAVAIGTPVPTGKDPGKERLKTEPVAKYKSGNTSAPKAPVSR